MLNKWHLVVELFLIYLKNIIYLLMGSSQSQQKISLFQNGYIKEPRNGHAYFGNHTLLINRNEKQMVILKQIIFHSSSEYRQFLSEYQKIERKPFSIVYPKLVVKNGGIETCSNIYEINAYFDLVGKSLAQTIKTQGCFNQSKAWFLLNQISKSLQILAQSNRPHWAISPQNIYQNTYQNYFIYDTFFVIGFDPQSFLMNKLQNNEIMTQKMRTLLQKGLTISPTEGFEEDCYCLGFAILFALTAIHPNTLPKDSFQRTQAVKSILLEKRGVLSAQIIQIILMLTERQTLRRMDNYQLRRLLKDKQAQIIRNQEHEFEKSRKKQGNTQTPRQGLQVKHNPKHATLPIHNPQRHTISHQNEGFPINPQLSNRITAPQSPIIRTGPIYIPYESYSQHTIKYPQVSQQMGRAHITQFVDYPSDRSNTLTRINSNDRLIPKR